MFSSYGEEMIAKGGIRALRGLQAFWGGEGIGLQEGSQEDTSENHSEGPAGKALIPDNHSEGPIREEVVIGYQPNIYDNIPELDQLIDIYNSGQQITENEEQLLFKYAPYIFEKQAQQDQDPSKAPNKPRLTLAQQYPSLFNYTFQKVIQYEQAQELNGNVHFFNMCQNCHNAQNMQQIMYDYQNSPLQGCQINNIFVDIKETQHDIQDIIRQDNNQHFLVLYYGTNKNMLQCPTILSEQQYQQITDYQPIVDINMVQILKKKTSKQPELSSQNYFDKTQLGLYGLDQKLSKYIIAQDLQDQSKIATVLQLQNTSYAVKSDLSRPFKAQNGPNNGNNNKNPKKWPKKDKKPKKWGPKNGKKWINNNEDN